MVQLKSLMFGNLFFLLGYFLISITQWIIPTLIDTLNSVDIISTSSYATTIEGILWIGTIVIWILVCCIIPSGIIILALKEPEDNSGFFNIPMGIAYFLFSILFFYFTYSWTVPLVNNLTTDIAGNTTSTILQIIFWISYIEAFLINSIAIPLYIIAEGKQ